MMGGLAPGGTLVIATSVNAITPMGKVVCDEGANKTVFKQSPESGSVWLVLGSFVKAMLVNVWPFT